MRNRQRRHDEFVRDNRVPEDKFLADCEIAPGTTEAHQAIAVRRAIAEIAEVPEAAISANHVFRGQLDQLGLWDSLDTVEFALDLEQHLGFKIPNRVLERIPLLNDQPGYAVRDMVNDILKVLREAGLPGPGK